MKRIRCMIICIMLILAGMPALAWGHPLDSEPFYDPASGVLSGTVFWTTSVQYEKDHPQYMESTYGWRYLIHSMNLDTGETRTYDMDDNYYLVYSDLPGVTVAKESDGVLYLYQMDLEGNLSFLMETELSLQQKIQWLPCTAVAYYDRCLYYTLSQGYKNPNLLACVEAEGNLFVYSDTPGIESSLSQNGLLAWFDDTDGDEYEDAVFIQNPEDCSITEILLKEDYRDLWPVIYPSWTNDGKLFFTCKNRDNNVFGYYLLRYDPVADKIDIVSDKNGALLRLNTVIGDRSQFNDEGTLLLQMVCLFNSTGDATPCITDLITGKEYKIAKGGGMRGNRAVWYND